MRATIDDLRTVSLLADLSAETLDALLTVAHRDDIAARQVVALTGDPAPPVGFVVTGRIRVFVEGSGGRQQTLARLGPGASFYVPPAFASDRHAPTSTETIVASRLVLVAQDAFREVTSEAPDLALAVMATLADRVRHLVALTHDLGLLSVRGRLASFLVRQHRAHPGEPITFTHEEIATSIGTVREVVSRTLRLFAREGFVRLDRQRLEIQDIRALEDEAEA